MFKWVKHTEPLHFELQATQVTNHTEVTETNRFSYLLKTTTRTDWLDRKKHGWLSKCPALQTQVVRLFFSRWCHLLSPSLVSYAVFCTGANGLSCQMNMRRGRETGHRAGLTRAACSAEAGSLGLWGCPCLQLWPSPWHRSASTRSDPWSQSEGEQWWADSI